MKSHKRRNEYEIKIAELENRYEEMVGYYEGITNTVGESRKSFGEGLILPQVIRNEAFTGAVVYAMQRLGKSSYAMQVMYDLYGNWDDVFKNMFFSIDELIDYLLTRVDIGEPLPCVVWDDAGVHGNKMLYFSDPQMADLLKRLFDVIGVATKGLLLTTPVPSELLKAVRGYEFKKIKIMKGRNENERVARCYKDNLLPSGTRRVFTEFDDEYNVLLPDSVYAKYTPIREEYYIESLHALHDRIKEKKLEQCMKVEELDRMEETLMMNA